MRGDQRFTAGELKALRIRQGTPMHGEHGIHHAPGRLDGTCRTVLSPDRTWRAQVGTLAPLLALTALTRVLVCFRLQARHNCELAGCAAASEMGPDLAEWNYGDCEGLRSEDIRSSNLS